MSSISKANTNYFPRADLTTIKLKLKTKRFTNSPCVKFDLVKLNDLKIAEMFQAKLGRKFAALCVFDSDGDTFARSLKEVLHSTAEEVLGRQRRRFNLGSQTRFWICATRDVS